MLVFMASLANRDLLLPQPPRAANDVPARVVAFPHRCQNNPPAKMSLGKRHGKLDIEVDCVKYHTDAEGNRKLDDLYRDLQLSSAGWEIRRFWVYELRNDMNGCVGKIGEWFFKQELFGAKPYVQ